MRRSFKGRWVGPHEELANRSLIVRLVEKTRFGNTIDIDQHELRLLDVAAGSVQQDIVYS